MLKPDAPERNEGEIRSLFQTMREADARRAPSFTQSLRAMPYRDRLGYLRAIVVTAVVAVILVVVGVNALRQRGTGEAPVPTQSAKAEPAAPAQTAKSAGESPASTRPLASAGGSPASTRPLATGASVQVAVSGGGTPPLQPAGRRRYKGAPSKVPSISEWKSPTEALLKTPGDDLRTTLPKIGYSPAKSSTAE